MILLKWINGYYNINEISLIEIVTYVDSFFVSIELSNETRLELLVGQSKELAEQKMNEIIGKLNSVKETKTKFIPLLKLGNEHYDIVYNPIFSIKIKERKNTLSVQLKDGTIIKLIHNSIEECLEKQADLFKELDAKIINE